MIVVDSSVWINHFRGNETPSVRTLRAPETRNEIVSADLVILEVLQGARDDRHAERLESVLRTFPIVSVMSDSSAVEAARIYRTLRAEGITVRKTVDLAIATFCIANDHSLLQSDRDFEAIAGRFPLRLI